MNRYVALLAASALSLTPAGAQSPDTAWSLSSLVNRPSSELANVVSRYSSDLSSVTRRYDASDSPSQRKRMRDFYADWQKRLAAVDFAALSQEGKVDYVLLDKELKHEMVLLDRREKQRTETAALLPFADRLLVLQDSRRDLAPVNPRAAASTLAAIAKQADSLRALFESGAARPEAGAKGKNAAHAVAPTVSKTVANRAADDLDDIRRVTSSWYRYYDGYDPLFTWWTKDPYKRLDESLNRYTRTLRERVVGLKPADAEGAANSGPIVGDPIGRKGLDEDLKHEMIPYTPEELIAIAEREYAFSLSEMKKASREMGFGDDWKAAMEKVKNTYVEPGKQPDLIRDLARQAETFFDQHDWVTIPAAGARRLANGDDESRAPKGGSVLPRRRIDPRFVSHSGDDGRGEDDELPRQQSAFLACVVFHELNPGHHLQGFMTGALQTAPAPVQHSVLERRAVAILGDVSLGPRLPLQPGGRIGALFWRMHRSARIIFSLSFHLGKMTPDQAIQFLVDTVNFERANAEGEVRRSFNGSYSPLYQVAYMIGGLELRALHKELVDSGKMTNRAFHDAVLQGGPMPIAMVRARLANISMTRDGPTPWKFAADLPPPVPSPFR